MVRKHHTLALITLLSSAPLITTAAAAAQPRDVPATADRTAPTAPVDTLHLRNTGTEPRGASTQPDSTQTLPTQPDLSTPATPVPMNLPDEATAREVKGQYGIGVAGLVIGSILLAAIVVGVLYVIARRSWSHSH